MANKIKGITIEIDGNTSKLDKALKSTNTELKSTQNELSRVNKLLKLDPGNTELIAQKQRLLGKAAEEAARKVEITNQALKKADEALSRGNAYEEKFAPLRKEMDALRDSIAKFTKEKEAMENGLSTGEFSTAEYDAVSKKLEELRGAMSELSTQKKALDKEFAGDKINQAGYDSIVQDLVQFTDEAERAEKEAKQFNSTLGQMAQKTAALSEKAGKVSSAFDPITKAIAGVGAAALATVPATEEFRADMAMLEQNAKNAELSLTPLEKAFQSLMVSTGDMSGSLKTLEALMDSGVTESNIQKSVDSLAGAVDRFPGSFKIDSLAESLQNTLESGQATGAFEQLLDQLGVDVEKFDTQMSAIPESANRLNMALTVLSSEGLVGQHESWLSMNQDVVQSREASLEFIDTLDVLSNSLKQTSENAGLWAQPAEEAFKTFLAVSGEVDSSIEAVSNLLQAGATESNLQKAVENLAGAAERFPDTLKIESLADSLQESVKTGEATGQFSELLERLGLSVEEFNGTLSQIPSEAERLNFALGTLSNEGLAQSHEGWMQENQDLADSRLAQYELTQATAELATKMQPLVTEMVGLATAVLDWFNGLDSGTQSVIVGILGLLAAVGPVAGVISSVTTAFSALAAAQAATSVAGTVSIATFGKWVIIIGLAIAAVTALVVAINTLLGKNKEMNSSLNSTMSRGSFGGGSGFSGKVQRSVSAEELPHLAQGTVARPNHPFTAVIGDNKTEPEIVSPYSTIMQAVKDAIGPETARSSAPANLSATVVLDGVVVGRLLVPYIDGYKSLRGANLVLE